MKLAFCGRGLRSGALLLPLLVSAPSMRASEILYGVDSSNDILSINITTGVATVAGTFTNLNGAPIGLGTFGSLLYALPGYSGGSGNATQLLALDPSSGFGVQSSINLGLGTASVNALTQGDIAFNSSGTLFIASATQQSGAFSGTLGALYSANTGTNTTTVLNGSFAPKFDGLAFDSMGTLFGLSREVSGSGGFTNSLYTLNTSTGAATQVGTNTGIADMTLNSFVGLAFSSAGTLYAIVGNTSASQLYTIDPTTGIATLVNPITLGGMGLGGIDGMTFFTSTAPSVPEPGTFGLISGALGLLVFLRRHRIA